MSSTVTVTVSETDADPERVDELAGYLLDELRSLDDVDVRRGSGGEAPDGSRAVDLMAIGGLIMTLLSSHALPTVLETIRGWLSRGSSDQPRTVRLEIDGDSIELGSATAEEQGRLVSAFIDRHRSDPAPGP